MAEANIKLQMTLDDRVSGELKKVEGSLGGFEASIKKMQPAFKSMAVAGAAGFAAIAAEAGVAIKAFSDSEAQLARVDTALRTVFGRDDATGWGKSFDAARMKAREFGSELQRLGGIGDEDAAEGLVKLAQITGDYTKATEAARIAADLSIYKQIDYGNAVDIVGKVLAGNTSILTRYGIVLEEGATVQDALNMLTERAGGQYEAYGKTVAGQTAIMKQTIGDLQENIGAALLPAIQKILTTIQPVIDKFVKWAGENPKLLAGILAVSAAAFALVAIIGTLGLALIGLSGAAAALGLTLGVFLGWLLIIPLAIAAVVAVGVLLYKNWDEIKAKAGDLWARLVEVWNGIKDSISAAWAAVLAFLSSVWESIKSAFWLGVDFIIGVWATLLDFLFPNWQQTLTQTLAITTEIFTAIGGAIRTAVAFMQSAIAAMLGYVSERWNSIWNSVKESFMTVWAAIKSVAADAFAFIKSGIDTLTAPLQKLIELANAAYNAAKAVASAAASAIAGGLNSVVARGASITGRASGGPVNAGTPYIVGEKGPELFLPGRSGTIIPNGVGGAAIYLTITGNSFYGEEDLVDKVGAQLMQLLKQSVKIS